MKRKFEKKLGEKKRKIILNSAVIATGTEVLKCSDLKYTVA